MAKRVLVTGADGFIGSHLTEHLMEKGYQVRGFTCYNSFGTWGWIDSFSKEKISSLEIVPGDIRDPYAVRKAMTGVDEVFHLAALIAIPFSYAAPNTYVDTNVNGTLNVLQAAKDLGTNRVLVTSTSEVYGTAQYVPIDEKHPLQAQSPYSASKIGADAIADSFYRSFELPITIVRPFNTYGPRQSARAFIPTLITQLLGKRDKIKLGSLHPTRDFNYVKDTANGFYEISICDKTIGEVVNIATNNEISMGEVAEELVRQINPNAQIILDPERVRPAKSEVERLWGDNTKIKSLTNWSPSYSFSEGIGETVDWIKQNMDRYKIDIYNL